jgi:hypothetical protein
MSTVVAGNNQTLVDIAMQVYGSAAGVWLLLQDNPTLLDPASPFVEPGMVLQVRPDLYQQAEAIPQVAAEYVRTGRDVAALNPSALLPNFPYRRCGIGYWRIGVDFVVGGTCVVAVPVVPLPTGIVDQFRVGDGTVTFTATNPGAGYEVQWSLDDFATVAATGLTFTPTVTVAGSPVPVYARLLDTTTFAVGGRVTAFAYVDPIFTFINAWYLDGVNDYISVPGAGGQFGFGTGDFCIEGWVYLDAAGGWIMENFGSDGRGFNISTSNNRFNAVFYGSGGTVNLTSTVTLAGRLGTWIHVLFQRVGTTLELYEDNVLRQSAAVGASSSNSTTSNLHIGARNVSGAPSSYLNGRLDEWRIYNRALTPTERAAVFNSGNGNFPPSTALANLVARYRFDTAAPTGPNFILNDSSGNGNHGTSSGISVSPLVSH